MGDQHFGHVDREFVRDLDQTPANDDGAIWVAHLTAGHEFHPPAAALDQVGAEIVLQGVVVAQPYGHDLRWAQTAIVKYPTRRSFVELTRRAPLLSPAEGAPEIVISCIPTPKMYTAPDLDPPPWAGVPHPATDEDSPVVVMHVIRHSDAAHSPDEHAAYNRLLANASIPHGARATRWFAAEGTILGDGRAWDDVRITAYPSCASYLAVIDELERDSEYRDHRQRLIADQYSVVIRPTIDRIVRSISH